MVCIIEWQFVAQIKRNCNDYEGLNSYFNYLLEETIMNSHIFEHIANENTVDILRSIELFIGIVAVASVIGFVCLAAV